MLVSISPIFSVDDVPQALAFYRDVLGFEIGWTWGEPPTYGNLCRNRVELNLGRPVEGESLSPSGAYVALTPIDEYYESIVARGAKVTVPIGDRPYGMRDFTVADVSGNKLSFGEPLSVLFQGKLAPLLTAAADKSRHFAGVRPDPGSFSIRSGRIPCLFK